MNVQSTYRPHARRNKDDVIIDNVGDEVIIYDLKNQHCYALNSMSATIWDLCDGQTTLPEMALVLKQANNLSDEEATVVIDASLEQLIESELLVDDFSHMVQSEASADRRTLLKKLGGLISLPAISSIVMQPALAQISVNCLVCIGVVCQPGSERCYNPSNGKCQCVAVPGCGNVGTSCEGVVP
jgi:hypothetical protein